MSTMYFLEELNEQVRQHVLSEFTPARADQLGLDIRAGYTLYVSDDAIAVEKRNDRTLQYYGGFEYVDEECRTEAGEYVFYFNEDERVADCLDAYEEYKADTEEVE